MTGPTRFDAAIGGGVVINTTADDLARAGYAPAEIAAAAAAAATRAIEAEMRRRIDLVWGGKRSSAQSYWTTVLAKGGAASADEQADAAAIASGDGWEQAMLDAAKALAARGDLDAARTDAAWPPPPPSLLALLAAPFAL